MITGLRGIGLIKAMEGLRPHAYLDAVLLPTIGYGHLLTKEEFPWVRPTPKDGEDEKAYKARVSEDFKKFLLTTKYASGLSETEYDELLKKDLKTTEDIVNRMVKVPLTQNQFDALVSLVFNIGPGSFGKSSALRFVNARLFDRVPGAMLLFNKARDPKTGKLVELIGLTKRRHREVELWLSA